MVHIKRLISSVAVATSCAITLFNICTICLAQSEDISRNLVRDPVELGNPYHILNSKVVHNGGGGGGGGTHHGRRKHPNHHRRPAPYLTLESKSSEEERPSSEDVLMPTPDTASYRKQKPEEHHTQRSTTHNNHHAKKSKEDCPMCAAERANSKLSDETLRELRIEMVKQQILKKLRLKEPPKLENIPMGHNAVLPSIALGNPMIASNDVRSEHDNDAENLDIDDFYGKPEQTIVLPEDELPDCSSWSVHRPHAGASSCFLFKLPKTVTENQISSAELWVYTFSDEKESDEVGPNLYDHHNHSFSVSEMLTISNYWAGSSNKRRGSPHFNTIADRGDISSAGGWKSFNITDRARKWQMMTEHEHTVRVSCSTCNTETNELPFATSGEQQPFIIFNIANGKTKRRSRRSVNCGPGVTECCRERLFISFAEIKWDWVVEPKGFDAYYCKGSCHGDVALGQSASHHSNILIDYVKRQGGVNNSTAELVPCCTATEMSSISLIYRDPQSYNTTFVHEKLPNMVVQSCGCK